MRAKLENTMMKKFLLGLLVAFATLAGTQAYAAAVVLDTFERDQSRTANNGNPVSSNTLTGPVAGVTSLFGNRTLEVRQTGGNGNVIGEIGDGHNACDRTSFVAGNCKTTYTVLQAVAFESLQFAATGDGANGGQGLFTFLHNNIVMGTATITTGTHNYLVNLINAAFSPGDTFSLLQSTQNLLATAFDESSGPITANTVRVPTPATTALIGVGLMGLTLGARRQKVFASGSPFRKAA